MKSEDFGYLSITREQLLTDPELLTSFYKLCGKDFIINWILRKKPDIKDDDDQ